VGDYAFIGVTPGKKEGSQLPLQGMFLFERYAIIAGVF
jgi:hypothetical protein